jgi:hypothetical protein
MKQHMEKIMLNTLPNISGSIVYGLEDHAVAFVEVYK